jgi:tetratricopeptide (TPR) repeat protein
VTPCRRCWLIALLVLGVACAEPPPQPRTAPHGGPGPDASPAAPTGGPGPKPAAAAATARAGPTAANAPLAAPEEVYREARDLVAQGRPDEALSLLQARVAHPREVRGAAAEENARLLAMLGELTAAVRPATDASYQRAETYLAWAIAADPCMGEYWHVFMRARLAHAGYAGVLAQLQHQEPLRYRTTDIGFSRSSTITLPWADYWLYLRGLLYAETHDAPRAVDSLLAFKRSRNTCPVDQTLGELYQLLRRPADAVVYLKPASEEVPGRRSARRYYVLGLALKALKDTAGARQAFLESSLLDPSFDATRSELLALDWQMTGDRDSDIASTHRLLSEHPADLASWLTFWETRYRNGVTPEAEFQRFADEVGSENPQLSQPAIAQTVSLRPGERREAHAGRRAFGLSQHGSHRRAALCRRDASLHPRPREDARRSAGARYGLGHGCLAPRPKGDGRRATPASERTPARPG